MTTPASTWRECNIFANYWQRNWQLNDPIWLKKKYAGYEDEFYVQFWHEDWKKIIYGNNDSYLKKILDAGFDGAFLDNVQILLLNEYELSTPRQRIIWYDIKAKETYEHFLPKHYFDTCAKEFEDTMAVSLEYLSPE